MLSTGSKAFNCACIWSTSVLLTRSFPIGGWFNTATTRYPASFSFWTVSATSGNCSNSSGVRGAKGLPFVTRYRIRGNYWAGVWPDGRLGLWSKPWSVDARGGCGPWAKPWPGVRPNFGLVTPHRIAEVIVLAAPRVRVHDSFWQRAASAWGCGVLVEWRRWSAGYFLWESSGIAEGAWRSVLGKRARLLENRALKKAVWYSNCKRGKRRKVAQI